MPARKMAMEVLALMASMPGMGARRRSMLKIQPRRQRRPTREMKAQAR
jgi:hypothetical protein